jgi:phosphoribosylaminoimidazole-succinocarboxamide synthase
MNTEIQDKGRVLTRMSVFWFNLVKDIVPNHVLASEMADMPDVVRKHGELEGRCLLVRRLQVFPVEAIVRGYLAGSAWKEYKQTGAVCGIALPVGLTQNAKLPEPLFTPSTKAEYGEHDENMTFEQMVDKVGDEYATRIKEIALAVYVKAAEHALSRGIIIADTKMEFGTDENGTLYIADELLTPDSSRFWPVDGYQKRPLDPPSFDKQYLRDYLVSINFDKQHGVNLPPAVVERTINKYNEAWRTLCE